MTKDTATKERVQKGARKNQGSKGHKADRLNMAFSPENSAFLDIVSKDYGMNKTALVNRILDLFREDHPEVMATAISHQKAQKLLHNEKEANA